MNHYGIKREDLKNHILAILATGMSIKDVALSLSVKESAIRIILEKEK